LAIDHGRGPKSTPLFVNGRIFTLGISGILSAFDAETGRRLWDQPAPPAAPTYSTSQSPLFENGQVIVHVGGYGKGALTSFNPATGAVNWEWTGDGPAYGSPIVVDLSLTQVTRGQILLLQREGKPIPAGWGMDKHGNPTTDAHEILFGGSLHAVGGLKGTMLALAVELLCCALTGAKLSRDVQSMHTDEGPPLALGQAFIGIDPGSLAGGDVYNQRVEALIDAMLEEPGVRLPGERRRECEERARREGIEIGEALLAELRALAGGMP
ncbi:MAG: Ldh family oxidoreductase, partial [Burkholderiales bacterium]